MSGTGAAPPKVSRELANSVYDDWKRKVVDDAKKRAVSQAVDYDTFKNMVSVAHLKPITAPSSGRTDRMLPSWRFGAEGAVAGGQAADAAAMTAASAMLQREPSEPPSTSADFQREWRRNCPTPEAKYRYLRLCGAPALVTLFKVEISCELLKELLAVLEGCWLLFAGTAEEGDEGGALREADFVVQVLQSLRSAGRFQLTVRLAGAASSKVLRSLFSQLEDAAQAASAANGHNTDSEAGAHTCVDAAAATDQLQGLSLAAGQSSEEGVALEGCGKGAGQPLAGEQGAEGSKGQATAMPDSAGSASGRAIVENLLELRKAYGV